LTRSDKRIRLSGEEELQEKILAEISSGFLHQLRFVMATFRSVKVESLA
jgi:hypothetical protein